MPSSPHFTPTEDFDDGLPGGDTDTARLWLSEQQWLSILERVERGPRNSPVAELADDPHQLAGGESDATGHREHPRLAASFRCVIRLAPPGNRESDHGTYLVHTRNISAGGLGFVHDHELHAGTRCTVALQPQQGKGLIVPARVAWCRDIQRLAEDVTTFDVGVQFDRPINIDGFVPAA